MGFNSGFKGLIKWWVNNIWVHLLVFIWYNDTSVRIWTRWISSNKSPTRCNNFSVYHPDVCLQLDMFRGFSCPSSGAQWLQWQPLVLPSYRGDSRAVFMVGPAGPTMNTARRYPKWKSEKLPAESVRYLPPYHHNIITRAYYKTYLFSKIEICLAFKEHIPSELCLKFLSNIWQEHHDGAREPHVSL